MKQKPCTSLPATEVDSLPTLFSATDQLSLLSGIPTLAKSLENAQQTDGSPACECGKGMSACLIHPSTPDRWIASMQDSLAKTLASLESKQAYLREPDQVFTAKFCVSLAWLDQNSCSWKTYQQSFLTDSEPYSETWPRWGMTQGGSAYAHPMSERRITETDGFYWPTPVVQDSRHAMTRHINPKSRHWESNLGEVVSAIAGGGYLNPLWVEHLMGFPIGFTDSKDWVTPKSRSKQQQPTDFLGDSDAP
jgi:hypothetical protein